MLAVWQVTKQSLLGFFNDRCIQTAAALSYTTLFALVPLVVLVVLILQAFPAFAPVVNRVQDFAAKNLVAHSASQLGDHFQLFIEHSRHLSVVGICFLVVVAVLMVFTMEKSFI